MNCLAVRERLTEHALAVLDPAGVAAVEHHLEWCAGCRREAAELTQAAAAFGLALPPAVPPDELEERIVDAVQRATQGPAPGRLRIRSAVASLIAAMVAVAALGWGAVMTGRADRERDRAQQAAQALQLRTDALDRFRTLLAGLGQPVPEQNTRLVQLSPTPDRSGGGAAVMLVSPRLLDFAMVIVNGLDVHDTYEVALEAQDGETLGVGRITELDRDGGGQVFRQFKNRDLSPFTRVIVRNGAGAVVLQGAVGSGSDLSSG